MVITLSPCLEIRQDGLNTLVNFRSELPCFAGQFSAGSNRQHEPGFEGEDSTWEGDEDFDLTEEDFQVMSSIGWESNDLPSDRDQDRYRQYLTKKPNTHPGTALRTS